MNICDSIGSTSEQEPERLRHFQSILQPLTSGFTHLLQQPDYIKIAHSPEMMIRISNYIESFRGIVRANIRDCGNNNVAFLFTSPLFGAFTGLMEVYKDWPAIITLILKFYCDLAQNQFDSLKLDQINIIFGSILELFRKFASHCSSRLAKKMSSKLANEVEKEAYNDLYALVKLLCLIGGYTTMYNTAQEVIFVGISTILPLINERLLEVIYLR